MSLRAAFLAAKQSPISGRLLRAKVHRPRNDMVRLYENIQYHSKRHYSFHYYQFTIRAPATGDWASFGVQRHLPGAGAIAVWGEFGEGV